MGDLGSIPGSRGSLEGNGNPLQCSCLEIYHSLSDNELDVIFIKLEVPLGRQRLIIFGVKLTHLILERVPDKCDHLLYKN